MINEAHVSLTGYIATQPVTKQVGAGSTNLSMRVAWTPRRMDRATGDWVDGNTSFVTVICWRKLAENAAICLRKGDPVVVKGRLSVRDYEDKAGIPRTAVEIEASSVGHDIARGVAQFQRVRPRTGMTAAEYATGAAGPDGVSELADALEPLLDGADPAAGGAMAGGTPGQPANERDATGGAAGSVLGAGIFDDDAIAELAEAAPAGVPA